VGFGTAQHTIMAEANTVSPVIRDKYILSNGFRTRFDKITIYKVVDFV
jgi:hypothetical protein